MIQTDRAQGVDCPYCEDGTEHEHTRPIGALAFQELREAWIEMPFDSVVPQGWGDPIQRLLNAVSSVVDPNRTLREDPEVKRRGSLAGYRQRHAFAVDQMKQASDGGFGDLLAQWTATRDRLVEECFAEHGVTP